MRGKDLLTLGALALGAYLLFQYFKGGVDLSQFGGIGSGGAGGGGGVAEGTSAAIPLTTTVKITGITPPTPKTVYDLNIGAYNIKNIPESAVISPTKAQQLAWTAVSKEAARSKIILTDIARVQKSKLAVPSAAAKKAIISPPSVAEVAMTKILLTRRIGG
jgi:hypothetical protein